MPNLDNFYNPKLLAELAVGYGNRTYVAALAMPIVRVPQTISQFPVFDQSNMLLDVESARTSPNSDVKEVDFGVAKTDVICKGYGYKHFIPNLIDEDSDGSCLKGATQAVMDELLNIRESIVLSKILACGNSTTISTKWDAASTDLGTVITGVEAMQTDLIAASGVPGNVLVMGYDVWATVKAKFGSQYTVPTVSNRQWAAEVLGVDRVLVVASRYVTKQNPKGTFDTPVVFWTAKTAALLNNGAAMQDEANAEIGSTAYTPSYGKIAQRFDGSLHNGIEWRSYEWANKGSHGGVYISGTMYIDAVETLNGACTLGTVLT